MITVVIRIVDTQWEYTMIQPNPPFILQTPETLGLENDTKYLFGTYIQMTFPLPFVL